MATRSTRSTPTRTLSRVRVSRFIRGSAGTATWRCVGRDRTGPATFLRLSTDDLEGRVTGYVAEGEFLDEELATFGGYGVARIPDLERLLDVIVQRGFEHHTGFARGHVAAVVREAMETYLRWPLYDHTRPHG